MKSILSILIITLSAYHSSAQILGDYFCEVTSIFESGESSEDSESDYADAEDYIYSFGVTISDNKIVIFDSSHSSTEYLFGGWTLITHKNGALRVGEFETQVYQATKKGESVEIVEAKTDQSQVFSRKFTQAGGGTLKVVGKDILKSESDDSTEDENDSDTIINSDGNCVPSEF